MIFTTHFENSSFYAQVEWLPVGGGGGRHVERAAGALDLLLGAGARAPVLPEQPLRVFVQRAVQTRLAVSRAWKNTSENDMSGQK